MIFVDATFFLRYLVQPVTPQDRINERRAAALFASVESGAAEITTSEAILAEVAFILNAKRHYGLPPAEVAARLRPFLRLTELRLARGAKERYLRALDLWSDHPRLGFVDALTAVTVAQTDVVLATFDSDFDGVPGITRWQPPGAGGGDVR